MPFSQHIDQCKLCGGRKKLVNSHIFSDFLYKPIYKEGGQYVELSSKIDSPKKGQGGLREKLLCEECEAKRSVWEKYAKNFLFSNKKAVWDRLPHGLYLISNIDYKKLKLFVLSTLWLCSVASKDEWFKKITLGCHEKIVGRMLLEEDPGSKHQYGIIMQKLKGENVDELILFNDGKDKIDGHNCYRMVFGGFFWWIFVTSHRITGIAEMLLMREDGKAMVRESDRKEIGWLVAAAKKFPLKKMFEGGFS